MNFFEQQEHARRRSRRLVIYFLLSVLVMVVMVYCIIAPCVLYYQDFRHHRMNVWQSLLMMWFGIFEAIFRLITDPVGLWKWIWDPLRFTEIAGAIMLVIAAGSFYKIYQLRIGGAAVAEFLGGRQLDPKPTDLDELKLRNVVEEMAIASSMPMPEIYVLDNERGINSFAAGYTTSDVAIGVTRGCLRLLTRDELQGVIAHEFSHILNGDTRLNMRLMGLAHGMLFPSILGRMLVHECTAGDGLAGSVLDRKNSAIVPFMVLGGLLQMTGWIGLPFVRLLKSAICREREWLADASAVQFTRNPEGIAGALKKIGGLLVQGRLRTPHAETASHLYFVNCSMDALLPCFATHPPLTKRISAIYPYFDGEFPKVKMLPMSEGERAARLEESVATMLLSESAQKVMVSTGEHYISPEQARQIADRFRMASVARDSVSDEVSQAIRGPTGAVAFIYALLLDADAAARDKQLEELQTGTNKDVYRRTLELAEPAARLDENARLAMVDVAMPALRVLTPEQHAEFMRNTQALIESDRAIVLFEYTLQKVLTRHLTPFFEGVQNPPVNFRSLRPLAGDCAVLLSALAHMDQDDPAAAQRAFTAGVEQLDLRDVPISLLDAKDCNLPQIDAALERAACGSLYVRRNLMYACAHAAAANGRVAGREILLLRAIGDALDCPVPPFVEQQAG